MWYQIKFFCCHLRGHKISLSPNYNRINSVKGLNPGVVSKVSWVWSSGWIGLLLLTVTSTVSVSVTVNNNSPIQDYVHPDDQTQPTFGINSMIIYFIIYYNYIFFLLLFFLINRYYQRQHKGVYGNFKTWL